jgi:hypothetical protein
VYDNKGREREMKEQIQVTEDGQRYIENDGILCELKKQGNIVYAYTCLECGGRWETYQKVCHDKNCSKRHIQ